MNIETDYKIEEPTRQIKEVKSAAPKKDPLQELEIQRQQKEIQTLQQEVKKLLDSISIYEKNMAE